MEEYPQNGDQAWQRLVRANERYLDESSRGIYLANLANEINTGVNRSHLMCQKPYATILTCSDSCVSPEIIFGEGLGLLFVVRVAGNVIEPATLGTIEYGVQHLGTPLLVIMGHEKCGAVIAAAGATEYTGGIGKLLAEIKPSIDHSCEVIGPDWWKSKDTNVEVYDKALRESIQLNAILQEIELLSTSEVIRNAVSTGKLKIVVAYYNVRSGKVEEVEQRLKEKGEHWHKEKPMAKKKKEKEEKKKGKKHQKQDKHEKDKH
eukprot:TRINITY_DN800_c0_g1_i1.p1 TRINITY_DN800_c0_g1~~TRINITY_DN800_c0_g1_i1.p1  ORF type:complete len:273 (-),score=68.32 TRINITY_DN800_c0_g1_i1:26-811(-)